jgi:hypothetical protein
MLADPYIGIEDAAGIRQHMHEIKQAAVSGQAGLADDSTHHSLRPTPANAVSVGAVDGAAQGRVTIGDEIHGGTIRGESRLKVIGRRIYWGPEVNRLLPGPV